MGDRPKFKPRMDARSKALSDLLGRPPLVAGENETAFTELRARVVEALQPEDVLEQIMSDNIVDRVWECSRWRRGRATLLSARVQSALNATLDPSLCRKTDGESFDSEELRAIIGKAGNGDPAAVTELDRLLTPHNLSFAAMADVVQVGDPDVLRTIGDIERQIFVCESRREAAVAEFFRYRSQKEKYLGQKAIAMKQQAGGENERS